MRQQIPEAGESMPPEPENEAERIAREGQRSPLDPPGVSGGTAGTGGDNKTQDDLAR